MYELLSSFLIDEHAYSFVLLFISYSSFSSIISIERRKREWKKEREKRRGKNIIRKRRMTDGKLDYSTRFLLEIFSIEASLEVCPVLQHVCRMKKTFFAFCSSSSSCDNMRCSGKLELWEKEGEEEREEEKEKEERGEEDGDDDDEGEKNLTWDEGRAATTGHLSAMMEVNLAM
jgi:hypothetical protein